jgi:hypothetical protein
VRFAVGANRGAILIGHPFGLRAGDGTSRRGICSYGDKLGSNLRTPAVADPEVDRFNRTLIK